MAITHLKKGDEKMAEESVSMIYPLLVQMNDNQRILLTFSLFSTLFLAIVVFTIVVNSTKKG